MRLNPEGTSVFLEVEFWLEKDGSIGLTARDTDGFIVTVNQDPSRPNGHPTLFGRLTDCLRKMGAPAPRTDGERPDTRGT